MNQHNGALPVIPRNGVYPHQSRNTPPTGSGSITSTGSIASLTQVATTTQNWGASNGALVSVVYSGTNGQTGGGYTYTYALAESGGAVYNAKSLILNGVQGSISSVNYINDGGISAVGTWALSNNTLTIIFTNSLSVGSAYNRVVVYTSGLSYAVNTGAVTDNGSNSTATSAYT